MQAVNLVRPWCGETFETTIDVCAGSQHTIEDCAVCCRPIELAFAVGDDGELAGVTVATDRD
jgi:hypothetical protein